MSYPLELYIGLRYTRAKRRNHFISFISFTSIIGITLGITALITILSVMNGFPNEFRNRILSITAHITVTQASGLENWQQVSEKMQQHPQVQAGAPFTQAEVMLNHSSRVSGALLQGILPSHEAQVSQLTEKITAGNLQELSAGSFNIILGDELAILLGINLGDKITVITPQSNVTPLGTVPVLKRFQVVGFFSSGMYQYDRAMALVHVADASRLLRLRDKVSGVRLKLQDPFLAPRIRRELNQQLPMHYRLRDWTQEHASFFRAVQIEKTAMFVILTLIVAVAAFNIVSALVMVVNDKQADIAILRTLGASPLSIMGIFIVQGITIGLTGTILGLLCGLALAFNVSEVVSFLERTFGITFLAPDIYPISELPSQVLFSDVAMTTGIAFALAVLATIYPAWRAARTQPAEALRYE